MKFAAMMHKKDLITYLNLKYVITYINKMELELQICKLQKQQCLQRLGNDMTFTSC